jgi:hypothetical protein
VRVDHRQLAPPPRRSSPQVVQCVPQLQLLALLLQRVPLLVQVRLLVALPRKLRKRRAVPRDLARVYRAVVRDEPLERNGARDLDPLRVDLRLVREKTRLRHLQALFLRPDFKRNVASNRRNRPGRAALASEARPRERLVAQAALQRPRSAAALVLLPHRRDAALDSRRDFAVCRRDALRRSCARKSDVERGRAGERGRADGRTESSSLWECASSVSSLSIASLAAVGVAEFRFSHLRTGSSSFPRRWPRRDLQSNSIIDIYWSLRRRSSYHKRRIPFCPLRDMNNQFLSHRAPCRRSSA